MAQKIQVLFTDDIDGGQAEGTVRFAIDGTDYEIDLSAAHNEELRGIFTNYIAHARKAGGTTRRGTARSIRKPSATDTVAARAWARENGYDIKERGRVPAEVVAKYREATSQLEPQQPQVCRGNNWSLSLNPPSHLGPGPPCCGKISRIGRTRLRGAYFRVSGRRQRFADVWPRLAIPSAMRLHG
jgi:hypothetical protein